MSAVSATQRHPTGVAQTVAVAGHPTVGRIHAGPDPRQPANPGHGSEPPNLPPQEEHGVHSAQTPSVVQQQLDLARQFAGTKMKFGSNLRVLERDEGETAGSENGMPLIAQPGADGAQGIEGDAPAHFHSLSTINFHFSIHRNLHSKKGLHSVKASRT